MLKIIGGLAVVGGLVFLAFGVDHTITPETRTKMLSLGRTTTGWFERNVHATDEYLRCCQLNPKQLDYCRDRAVRMLQDANLTAVPLKVTDQKSGVGPVTFGK